jgi:hypothetical protein
VTGRRGGLPTCRQRHQVQLSYYDDEDRIVGRGFRYFYPSSLFMIPEHEHRLQQASRPFGDRRRAGTVDLGGGAVSVSAGGTAELVRTALIATAIAG